MKLALCGFGLVLLVGPIAAQRAVSIPVAASAAGKPAQIQCDLYGAGRRAVLLAHGGRFNKDSWKEQAQVLARAGFLVLAINFRGDTFNLDGTPSANGSDEDNATDVLAAAAYLRGMGVKTIAAIGASLGGDAVGNAEARSGGGVFDRMIFLGSEGGDAPVKLRGRKLYIVARGDANTQTDWRLPGIARHYDRAPEPKQLILLEGTAHAQYLFATDEGSELMRDILKFLSAK